METLPITLIVKAPNQQIEDQTIKCELSWTINKLKQHLSEVYPSKPAKHEQKLIYSGQLLNDSVTLKDVLRQYEGQETHTVHLVCTAQNVRFTKPRELPVRAPRPPPVENPPAGPAQETAPPDVSWDPNQYAMQVAMMQQTYLQYMMQYMQLAANSYDGSGLPTPAPPTPDTTGPQNAAEAPQPPAAPAREQEHVDRDWLEVFYMISRAMVLFSVVYFYSSPLRFVFVLLLGSTMYLYQMGFFRNMNNNNNNNNNVVPPQPVPEQEQAPSRLMVVWTFFATFFASLIPEIPNAL